MTSLKRQALKAIRVGVPVVLARAATDSATLITLMEADAKHHERLLEEHLAKIREVQNVDSVGTDSESKD